MMRMVSICHGSYFVVHESSAQKNSYGYSKA